MSLRVGACVRVCIACACVLAPSPHPHHTLSTPCLSFSPRHEMLSSTGHSPLLSWQACFSEFLSFIPQKSQRSFRTKTSRLKLALAGTLVGPCSGPLILHHNKWDAAMCGSGARFGYSVDTELSAQIQDCTRYDEKFAAILVVWSDVFFF